MLFQSRFRKLCLIIESPTRMLVGNESVLNKGCVVQFDDFKVKVDDPETIKKMLAHPKYNIDFFSVEAEKKKVAASLRTKDDESPGSGNQTPPPDPNGGTGDPGNGEGEETQEKQGTKKKKKAVAKGKRKK